MPISSFESAVAINFLPHSSLSHWVNGFGFEFTTCVFRSVSGLPWRLSGFTRNFSWCVITTIRAIVRTIILAVRHPVESLDVFTILPWIIGSALTKLHPICEIGHLTPVIQCSDHLNKDIMQNIHYELQCERHISKETFKQKAGRSLYSY